MVQDKEFIYHYSNIEGIVGILKNKNIRLFHCSDFEDKNEGEYVLKKLKKDLMEYNKIYDAMIDNTYIGSFSKEQDCKYLWNNYGNINIGFDLEEIQTLKFIRDKEKKTHETSGIQFGSCIYSDILDKDYMNILCDTKENLNKINFSDIESQQINYLLSNQSFYLKSKDPFEQEKEYRLVSHLWQRKPSVYKNRKYIEFLFTSDKVKTITVGPGESKVKDIEEIEKFIKNNKQYNHITINESRSKFIND